jgi:hypothetical protein
MTRNDFVLICKPLCVTVYGGLLSLILLGDCTTFVES